jgi:hypothetical protein
MLADYNPIEYLTKIQNLKYRTATLPIIIVVVSFGINMIFKVDIVKYCALLGLIFYVFVLMRYRIKKQIPPENSGTMILSPIHGKIFQIDANRIKIKKHILEAADFRCSSMENIEIEFLKSQLFRFENDCNVPGKLIGIIPHSVICIITIPENYEIEVTPNKKVEAGETILAKQISKKIQGQ